MAGHMGEVDRFSSASVDWLVGFLITSNLAKVYQLRWCFRIMIYGLIDRLIARLRFEEKIEVRV